MGISIVSLLSAVIVVLFFSAIMPSLLTAQGTLVNTTNGCLPDGTCGHPSDPVAGAVAGLIVLVVIIAFVIGIFNEATPSERVEYY